MFQVLDYSEIGILKFCTQRDVVQFFFFLFAFLCTNPSRKHAYVILTPLNSIFI